MAFFAQAIGPDLKTLSWLAIFAFFGVLSLGIAICWPQKKKKDDDDAGWKFGLDPIGVLDESRAGMTEAAVIEEAARSIAGLLPRTDEKLDYLARQLTFQWAALGLEVFFWTLDLAGR